MGRPEQLFPLNSMSLICCLPADLCYKSLFLFDAIIFYSKKMNTLNGPLLCSFFFALEKKERCEKMA